MFNSECGITQAFVSAALCGGSLQESLECGKPVRPAGSRLFQPPKKKLTRSRGGAEDVREERKEMKGGNGVREANGITQFAEGEPKV